eukprot:3121744-Pleurochrysis_carterae.AAC.2
MWSTDRSLVLSPAYITLNWIEAFSVMRASRTFSPSEAEPTSCVSCQCCVYRCSVREKPSHEMRPARSIDI